MTKSNKLVKKEYFLIQISKIISLFFPKKKQMIFVAVHMAVAAVLHVVFSEDIVFWRKGMYLKFFHNVAMNSFASIYFHNYLRFDEMPVTARQAHQLG